MQLSVCWASSAAALRTVLTLCHWLACKHLPRAGSLVDAPVVHTFTKPEFCVKLALVSHMPAPCEAGNQPETPDAKGAYSSGGAREIWM